MRLLRSPTGGDVSDLPPVRRPGDHASAGDPVQGSWSATRWQYTSREDHDRVVDVVAGLGGSVTLSLSDGTWVLTWQVPGRESGTVGGSLTIDGLRMDLLRPGAPAPETVRFHLAPDTLSLSSETSSWDFGSGEEPADFVAVLVRL